MNEDPEQLSADEIADFRRIRPILAAVSGFGRVMYWLSIGTLSIIAGTVLLGESIQKIVQFFWPPPPH